MIDKEKAYKHIYFDLDRTIWDFEKNAQETFKDIYNKYQLDEICGSYDNFYSIYAKHNERLWQKYREGKIEKKELSFQRFALTLNDFNIDDEELAKKMAHDYITISPTKKALLPNAIETLDYLKDRYKLYIITNGFNEVQFTKVKNSNLDHYFSEIFTSENMGAQKPNPVIFENALNSVHAEKHESLMIGDDLEVDILGAKNIGLDQIFFNPKQKGHQEKITHEICNLKELTEIL